MLHDYELDLLGALCNTDKSSISHSYLEMFGFYFRPFKSKPINIFELGVQDGFSIKLWLDYFDKATVVAFDWGEAARRFAGERVVIHVGLQNDPEILLPAAASHPPTIVIDDCSHLAYETMTSLEILFRVLEPGGVYIIEDLYFHRPEIAHHWRGSGDAETPNKFFARHAGYQMGRYYDPAGQSEFDAYFHEHCDFITSIRSAVIIGKKPRKNEVGSDVFDAGERLAGEAGTALAWSRFATFIDRHGGPIERVENALRHSIAFDSAVAEPYLQLSEAYFHRGDLDKAADVMNEALAVLPNDFFVLRGHGMYSLKAGRYGTAQESLRKARELDPSDIWVLLHQSDMCERMGRYREAIEASRTALEVGAKQEPAYLQSYLDRLLANYGEAVA